jgi:hypothetical protein
MNEKAPTCLVLTLIRIEWFAFSIRVEMHGESTSYGRECESEH